MFQLRGLLRLRFFWRPVYVAVVLVVVLTLAAFTPNIEGRGGYVILIMALFWVLEPVPVEVTSLLPIVLFPLLSVISTKEAALPYMNSTNMMFIGGLLMAIGIENCNLHKRIALAVLMRVGPSPKWMMMGFMGSSMVLSMWISNTATAAMMVPILDAVLTEMEHEQVEDTGMQLNTLHSDVPEVVTNNSHTNLEHDKESKDGNGENKGFSITESQDVIKRQALLRKCLFLSVAYSTNIGGTGTLTGTGPNLVLKGLVEDMFEDNQELSYGKWMVYSVPGMLVCVFLAWVFLYLCYLRRIVKGDKDDSNMGVHFKSVICKKHEELGPLGFAEIATLILFGILICLWVFRDPQFIPGWLSLFPNVKITDATAAIGIPLIMFVIPKEPRKIGQCPTLLTWKVVQRKMPWGIILLLGSGFSIAEASQKSGLSKLAGEALRSMGITSPLALVAALCFLTAMLTEFTSNVATANILLPVIGNLAVAMGINPLYLMIPVTISSSFAFMLPVATPPNAIVFEAGKMKTLDMVLPGIFMNILCCSVEILMISTLGFRLFRFDTFPEWANTTKGTVIEQT